MSFEILKSTNNQFYWRIVASNGEVLAHSETYTSKAGCTNAIGVVAAGAASAAIADKTGGA